MNAPPRNDNATGQGGVGEAAKQTEQLLNSITLTPCEQARLADLLARSRDHQEEARRLYDDVNALYGSIAARFGSGGGHA